MPPHSCALPHHSSMFTPACYVRICALLLRVSCALRSCTVRVPSYVVRALPQAITGTRPTHTAAKYTKISKFHLITFGVWLVHLPIFTKYAGYCYCQGWTRTTKSVGRTPPPSNSLDSPAANCTLTHCTVRASCWQSRCPNLPTHRMPSNHGTAAVVVDGHVVDACDNG